MASGIGGGTVRDLLTGAPIFWLHQNRVLLICMAAALIVWFMPLRLSGGTALVWFEGCRLAGDQPE